MTKKNVTYAIFKKFKRWYAAKRSNRKSFTDCFMFQSVIILINVVFIIQYLVDCFCVLNLGTELY